jgi:hypothetical protein
MPQAAIRAKVGIHFDVRVRPGNLSLCLFGRGKSALIVTGHGVVAAQRLCEIGPLHRFFLFSLYAFMYAF